MSFLRDLVPLAQTPGPDLACQDAVMERQEIINRENNRISTSRRARAGLNSEPGAAHFR